MISFQKYRKQKFIGLYVLSLLLIVVYYGMSHSAKLHEFPKKADSHCTDYGFAAYFWIGLIQYSALIAGILIPVFLTWFLIREIKKKSK